MVNQIGHELTIHINIPSSINASTLADTKNVQHCDRRATCVVYHRTILEGLWTIITITCESIEKLIGFVLNPGMFLLATHTC